MGISKCVQNEIKDSTSITLLGQPSLSSSFPSRSFNPFINSKENTSRNLSKISGMLLSEFFGSNSATPGTVKGKSRPFSSLLAPRDSSGVSAQTSRGIDEAVFQQFKHTNKEKDDRTFSDRIYESERFIADDTKESGKRRKLFEGAFSKPNAGKHVVIIGGDSKPKQKARKDIPISSTRSRPLYNHYATGSGWWDCNMAGVDSEEVGFGQVWEGVGSTTFGEI